MAKQPLHVRYIRLVSKERPTDRFLTAQARETKPGLDESGSGDLYFLVEIHNPWFPNSQIGQTIINTIVREYRRSESSSLLTNFELALRKTNLVLSQITQTGETDWIGNLSSVIALSVGGNIYIAQTGQARGYLLRAGKLSEITEGLDEEASQHPLTTYTNITSGALEAGDRIILASSQLTDIATASDIRTILSEDSLSDAGRELVKTLQRERGRRVFAFLLEVNPQPDFASGTVYTDQSLNNVVDLWNRFVTKTLRPSMLQSADMIREQATQAAGWTRDWLIPRVITWGRRGGEVVSQAGTRAIKDSQPLLDRTTTVARKYLGQLQPPAKPDELVEPGEPLAGTTIYRVHHYGERKVDRQKAMQWAQPIFRQLARLEKIVQPLIAKLRLKKTSKFPLAGPQILLLGAAIIAVIVLIFSTTHRRNQQVASTKESTAATALEQAQSAQQTAETLFVGGQKEAAKAQFLAAVAKAREASTSATTQAQAAEIIAQSEKVLDQLMGASRLESAVPLAGFEDPTNGVAQFSNQIVATDQKGSNLLIATSDASDQPTAITLPAQIGSPNAARVISNAWYLLGHDRTMYQFQPATKTITPVNLTSGSLEGSIAFAAFGSTFYLLDTTTGQIWKHTLKDGKLSDGKAYVKTADPTLSDGIDVAIDGDVYVLSKTGTLRKFTKGVLANDFQLKDLPTPWNTVTAPLAIFASPDSDHIYLLENKIGDQPARMIEMKKTGAFSRQLLLPDDWQPEAWSFDPNHQTGLIVSNHKVYQITFPAASN